MNEYVIETRGLSRRFGRQWAVKNLNLQIRKGAVFGFLGRNGAGKTTTIKMLMGLLPPTKGEAFVLNHHCWSDYVKIRQLVGYVPEIPVFYDWLTVAQTIGFVANYHTTWDWNWARELLKQFALDEQKKVRHLSKGMKAKLSLLLALGFLPEVLILDEPTFGLDPIARKEFIQSVLRLYQEEGKSIFISSHLITEISGLVDWVGIIDDGVLLMAEPMEKLLAELRQVRLVFQAPAPQTFSCNGLLRFSTDGREAVLTVRPFVEEKVIPELRRLNPVHLEVNALNLEDAFIELVKTFGTQKGE